MLENASVCKLFETSTMSASIIPNSCFWYFYLPFMHIIAFNIILPQFEITLFLKAQSDKTPVINLLVFK